MNHMDTLDPGDPNAWFHLINKNKGSVALLSHFDKVLALSKFTLLMCEIEVNPVAWIPWDTSTM